MTFHAKDLRKGRFSETGRIYLVTTVTHDREALLADLAVAKTIAAEMHHAEATGDLASLAWVLMPDHLHWLFSLRSAELSRVLQRFKSRTAIAINRERDSTGPVWQSGFHDRALRHDEQVRDVARYLIANPLRAGLIQDIGAWPYWDAVWLDRV